MAGRQGKHNNAGQPRAATRHCNDPNRQRRPQRHGDGPAAILLRGHIARRALMGAPRHAARTFRLLHPHPAIFVRLASDFFSCDKWTIYFTEQEMATLEAFRAVLDDEGTPEIIRNHIIDSLQYTLRNHGQIFTSKEVEWLSGWDDARIPLAASRELQKRVAETTR
jgi:hypothetical protein